MRELGAAIALEPGNIDAGRAVLRVLATPPRHTPTTVRAELDAIDNAQLAAGTRTSTPLAMLWLLFVPLVLVMRVLDWRPVAATLVSIVLVIAVSAINVSKAKVPIAHQIVAYLLRLLLCLSTGFLGGPFVMVPTFLTTFIAVLQSHPARSIRVGAVVMGCGLFAFMVALEWAGVLPSSYAFVDGGLRIVPVAVGLPETPTRVLLLLSALALDDCRRLVHRSNARIPGRSVRACVAAGLALAPAGSRHRPVEPPSMSLQVETNPQHRAVRHHRAAFSGAVSRR